MAGLHGYISRKSGFKDCEIIFTLIILSLTIKNCDKIFLKNILRLLKNDGVSTLAKRHYQVKKKIFVSCSLYIPKQQ